MEDNGFVVDVFNDFRLALINFKPGFYELLIFDIRMPMMDGLELYQEIRKLDDKVKVCFLTAFEMYDEMFRESLQKLDSDGKCLISKPIEPYNFIKKIKQELNQH